jgi:Ca2+:H+ antiporter
VAAFRERGTKFLFLAFGKTWLADLSSAAWFSFILGWLFSAILLSAFAVIRYAEALALQLGEPFGTLVLMSSMSGIEMLDDRRCYVDRPGAYADLRP